MNATTLLQRLQNNPAEAIILYPTAGLRGREGGAWIVSRQGIISHRAHVDTAFSDLADRQALRCVACQWPSGARLYRPKTDFQP